MWTRTARRVYGTAKVPVLLYRNFAVGSGTFAEDTLTTKTKEWQDNLLQHSGSMKSSFILRWPKLILNNLSRKNKILIIFVRLQDTSLLLSTLDTLLSSTPSTLGTLNKDSIHHLKDNSRPLRTVNGSAQSCLDVMQYFFVHCTSVCFLCKYSFFYSWFFFKQQTCCFFKC